MQWAQKPLNCLILNLKFQIRFFVEISCQFLSKGQKKSSKCFIFNIFIRFKNLVFNYETNKVAPTVSRGSFDEKKIENQKRVLSLIDLWLNTKVGKNLIGTALYSRTPWPWKHCKFFLKLESSRKALHICIYRQYGKVMVWKLC
jgi:hypothetical protein